MENVVIFDPIKNFTANGNLLQEELITTSVLPYIVCAEYYIDTKQFNVVAKDCMLVSNFFHTLLDNPLIDVYIGSVMSGCVFENMTHMSVVYDNSRDEEDEVRYIFRCLNEPQFSLLNIGEAIDVPEYFR